MSYMKMFLESSMVHIEAVSLDGLTRFITDIKASSLKEAEIMFFSMMRVQKNIENDMYTIEIMNIIRSE